MSIKRIEKFSGIHNLTKENFFNKLSEQFPLAMEQFSRWLQNYKSETRWGKTFGSRNDEQVIIMPEFYEIPFEMQMGILIAFFRETAEDSNYPNVLNYLPINEFINNFELYVIRGFHRLEISFITKPNFE